MKLDDASKVTAITSTIVAMIVSVAAYISNSQVQALDAKLQQISFAAKSFEHAKEQFSVAARIAVEYATPLAREFALQVADQRATGAQQLSQVMIPTNALSDELLGQWRQRKGLMTGQACQKGGLKARQIALLQTKNYGTVMAESVVLRAGKKSPSEADKDGRWNVLDEVGTPVAYADLGSIAKTWDQIDIPIGTLMGSDVTSDKLKTVKVVLASVSGSTDFYGPILVPEEITWIDPLKKEKKSIALDLVYFRSALLGAEIGSLSAGCR
ncbi:hypothetical protein [Pseudomonas putida]|uniref:hypothetical protein n=1 Tax=Pseudomonas putida TaxID=303 RepID=UPI002365018C|nr:hypothetical protein [Pseudomonas putida]MDD2047568.1 hypothetical protein [Pseudomonas putida]